MSLGARRNSVAQSETGEQPASTGTCEEEA